MDHVCQNPYPNLPQDIALEVIYVGSTIQSEMLIRISMHGLIILSI